MSEVTRGAVQRLLDAAKDEGAGVLLDTAFPNWYELAPAYVRSAWDRSGWRTFREHLIFWRDELPAEAPEPKPKIEARKLKPVDIDALEVLVRPRPPTVSYYSTEDYYAGKAAHDDCDVGIVLNADKTERLRFYGVNAPSPYISVERDTILELIRRVRVAETT